MVTGDSNANLFSIIVTEGNIAADPGDSYDLAIVTDAVLDGGFGYDFSSFDDEDYVSLVVGDNTSEEDFHLYGNAFNNVLASALGDDILLGRGGDDVLFGGSSGLNLLGGVDIYNGGDGDDTIIMLGATGDTIIGGDGGESDGDTLIILGHQAFTSAFGAAAGISGIENLTLAPVGAGSGVTGVTAGFNSSQLGGGLAADLHVTGSFTTTDRINITMNGASANLSGWSFTNWTGSDEINIAGSAANNVIVGSLVRDVITGGAGNDSINGGLGNDAMSGGGGNDTYFVNVAADTTTEAANAGTDTVQSSVTRTLGANIENLTLTGSANINGTGNALANVITGNAKVNILNGSGGNDTLNGGVGKDQLTGGAGGDKFVFNVAAVAGNVDTIHDFTHDVDTIQLDNAIFTALGGNALNLAAAKFWVGANAHDANDRVVYNPANGQLFYDANGNANGQKILIATLDAGLTLTASDFQVI